MASCAHENLRFTVSDHAKKVGYRWRSTRERLDASCETPAKRPTSLAPASTFPAPLVLPDDELAWEPDYDEQSVKEWIDEETRNQITAERQTIYLVPCSAVSKQVSFVKQWAEPTVSDSYHPSSPVPRPSHNDVLAYLRAFYHGLPVKLLQKPRLQYREWTTTSRKKATQKTTVEHIALDIGNEAIRIRARPSKDGIFPAQLNLDDLLDAAIAILPDDAYAVLMLVDHDLYEDDEDDFCCGRAYGGSRVAVISTARYMPNLDQIQNVENDHAWPASHCAGFMDDTCREASDSAVQRPKKKPNTAATSSSHPLIADTAITNAVRAYASVPRPSTPQELSNLWLGRVCKTSSHELGHCVAIDHCCYYACIMQGTAGLSEDVRQPPYLCPVDLAKVLATTHADACDRYRALLGFCERFDGKDRLFTAFAAWLRFRIDRELALGLSTKMVQNC